MASTAANLELPPETYLSILNESLVASKNEGLARLENLLDALWDECSDNTVDEVGGI